VHTLELLTGPSNTPVAHQFPGAWPEVRAEQLPKLALLLAVLEDNMETRLSLLRFFTGLPASTFAAPHGVPLEDLCTTTEAKGDQPLKVNVLPQLDWCFTPPDLSPEKPGPAISLLPTVKLNGVVYTGPGDGLDNFAFERFVWVDSLFQRFAEEANEENLHHWLGAAYQPESEPWSNEPIEGHAEALKALPHDVKMAAVLNYRGLRAALAKLYGSVFAHDPTAPAGTTLGLFGMFYDVADGGVFGPVPAVKKTPMHEVLGYVEHSNQKAHAQQASAPMLDPLPQ
jgi:hypothetical protein